VSAEKGISPQVPDYNGLKGILPALARLGAGDPEVRPTAAGTLRGHDGIPKAAS
jgi:hypothetical protein